MISLYSFNITSKFTCSFPFVLCKKHAFLYIILGGKVQNFSDEFSKVKGSVKMLYSGGINVICMHTKENTELGCSILDPSLPDLVQG